VFDLFNQGANLKMPVIPYDTGILSQLEQLGHIVIMDREAGDYRITTKDLFNVSTILIKNKVDYTSEYSKEYNNYLVDFNIYRSESYN
jgi:hypothetical protein